MKKRKSQRTEDKIIKMFYQLNLEQGKPLSTVPQICDALDIAVSTFYCHFSGINDIIELESQKLLDFWVAFTETYTRQFTYSNSSPTMSRETVAIIVKGYVSKKNEHLVLMRPDLNLPIRHSMLELLLKTSRLTMKFIPKEEREYAVTFLTQAVIPTILSYLVKEDMSVDAFTDLLTCMCNSVAQGVYKAQ